jgi:hypothetical protein
MNNPITIILYRSHRILGFLTQKERFMRQQNRHHYRDPHATARVKRGNEPRAPRLLPCACPSSPRTGHALVAPHPAAVPADQGSHLAIARCLDEIRGRSVYHLTTSLGEERERDFNVSNERVQIRHSIIKEIRSTYCHQVEDSSLWHSPTRTDRSLPRVEGGHH